MKNTGLYKLGKSDAVKAFWVFLISTVVGVVGDAIMQELNNGNYSIDAIHWREIIASIVVAVIAYLKKQFLSNENGDLLKKDEPKLNG